jgi:hypothetical protein
MTTLKIASDDRDHPILVCDERDNDIAEFFHSDQATVSQSYEQALALAKMLVAVSSSPLDLLAEVERLRGLVPVYLGGSRT